MILFLFSIFNMKKLFSIVSPPTFHLVPRSLDYSVLFSIFDKVFGSELHPTNPDPIYCDTKLTLNISN